MNTPFLPHVIVVDDDTRIRELLKRYLHDHGFFISTAKNAKEAMALLEYVQCDLLIVDVMMPGESGIELTRNVRRISKVPVLMLTAMSEAEHRIAGLESGADDYLSKPFEPRELLLRIERILQRTMSATVAQEIKLGMLQFDPVKNILSRQGANIPLTSAEARLLTILLENKGKPVSRSLLAELSSGVNERSIDVQIIRLRTKIEDDPKKPTMLKTIRGEGYVLYP
jgi:two-component system, OmpR family, phosphate regulon response regulator OmpR